MLRRYVSHIPARHFKMVRYYGFLANRKRGALLPKVYDALEMTVRELQEMLAERSVNVDHSTVYRWVQRYPPMSG